MVTKVIRFPNSSLSPKAEIKPANPQRPVVSNKRPRTQGIVRILITYGVRCLWASHVLLWPITSWVIALDVVYQFGRMIYLWEMRGPRAGVPFLLHFGVLVVLTFFAKTNVFKDTQKF